MVKKSIKQKSKYISFALNEGIILSDYIRTLTYREFEIIATNSPEILKYLTGEYTDQLHFLILKDIRYYNYFSNLSDEDNSKLIKSNEKIIEMLKNPTDIILDFVCAYDISEAVKLKLLKKQRRKVIEDLVNRRKQVLSEHRWREFDQHFTDYDRFYINILTNNGHLYWPQFASWYIKQYSDITTMSILTDGPDQIFAGGFDFDIKFEYLG